MTPDDRSHHIVRAALDELRAADERAAPAFEHVVRRRPAARAQPIWPRLALAAGVLLGLGVGYRTYVARANRFTVPKDVIALSTWTAPTDVLLEMHVSPLLKQAPQLGASLIDHVTRGELR